MDNNKFVFDLMDKHPPLSENALKEASVEKRILHNLRFAYTQAKKYALKYPGLDDDEVIEAMFLATTEAVNKWDPEKSKITPYIAQYVRLIIKRMSNESRSTIGRNSMYIWKSYKIHNFVVEFQALHKRKPTIDEIKAETGFPAKTIYNVYNLGIKSITGFDVKAADDSAYDLHEVIADNSKKDPAKEYQCKDISVILQRLIEDLTDLERDVINGRWYEGMKYNELSVSLDIPYQNVKKIEVAAMAKIRKELDAIEAKA